MSTRIASASPDAPPGRQPLATRWQLALLGAQAGWVVIALMSLAVFIISLEEFRSDSRLFWLLDDTIPEATVRAGLSDLGLSLQVYATIGIGFLLARGLTYFLIGLLLFWRKRSDPLALMVAYLLVALPSGETDPTVLLALWNDAPLRTAVTIVVQIVAFVLLYSVFLVFPDGRFRPPWTRFLALGWAAIGVSTMALPGSPLDVISWPAFLQVVFVPAFFVPALLVQVWRYRRMSNLVQRQQTKWVALGIGVILLDFSMYNVLLEWAHANWPNTDPARVVLTDLALHAVHNLVVIAFPVSLAIAILRYRLWDIGTLINRALVYASLSATLAGVYLLLIVLFQQALQAATGSVSDLAIAGSTLITAALFRPLRARLQGVIDRRFYRRRYDAAQTVSAFGSALRDETDLIGFQSDLVRVVHHAMRPAHVSLWLRAPAKQPIE